MGRLSASCDPSTSAYRDARTSDVAPRAGVRHRHCCLEECKPMVQQLHHRALASRAAGSWRQVSGCTSTETARPWQQAMFLLLPDKLFGAHRPHKAAANQKVGAIASLRRPQCSPPHLRQCC